MYLDFYDALLKIIIIFFSPKEKQLQHLILCTRRNALIKVNTRSKHCPIQESIEIQTSEMQIHFLKLPKIRISGMNASNFISNIFSTSFTLY